MPADQTGEPTPCPLLSHIVLQSNRKTILRHFASVESMLSRYVELAEQQGSIPAITLYSIEGERCSSCGKGPSYDQTTRRTAAGIKRSRRVCYCCGKPWVGEEIAVLKRQTQTSRRADPESALIRKIEQWGEEWAELRELVEQPVQTIGDHRWRIGVMGILGLMDGASIDTVTDKAKSIRPSYGWTYYLVERAIKAVHVALHRRLSQSLPGSVS